MAKRRNRIKGHRDVRAGDLVPHERNAREHTKAQRAELAQLFGEIGQARSLLGYELPDGRVKLIDGHLRASMDPDEVVTVEIVDVSDAEALKLLATLDPIAAQAKLDGAKYEDLLRELGPVGGAVGKLLEGLRKELPLPGPPELEISPELHERQDYVVILCENDFDWRALTEALGLGRVQNAAVGSTTFEHKGQARVVLASKVLELLGVGR